MVLKAQVLVLLASDLDVTVVWFVSVAPNALAEALISSFFVRSEVYSSKVLPS